MLKPDRMRKVSVFASKSDMEKVIEKLHERKAYHIVEHKADEIDIGNPLKTAEEIDESLISAKSLISEWKIEGEPNNTPTVKQAIKKINKISSKSRKFYDKEKKIEEEVALLRERRKVADVLDKVGIEPEYFNNLESVKGVLGTVRKYKDLESALNNASETVELMEEEGYVAVFFKADEREDVMKVLQTYGFSELSLPEDLNTKGIDKKITSLEKEKESLQKEKEKFKAENAHDVIDSEAVLSVASDKASVPLKFAVSDNVFYVEGYVPEEEFEGLEKALNKATKNKIHFKELDMEDENEIPIKLEHTNPVKPFEFFMDLYALPKYSEFDPTVLTFITFPILFGFMLGDMGYGAVTLIAFLIMRNFVPNLRRLINILIASSIWTIIFGLMFGEVFGEEVLFGFHFPHILSRLHDINDLLILSFIVGIVHVNIGLIVGFYNELKGHGFKAALFEKGGWFVLQGAAVLFGLNYMNGLSLYYGFGVLAVAIGMIFKGEGVQGLVELPSIFSNILSYARLMAIGLASAGLAVVVNQFAKEFFAQGASGILPAVLILIFGHFINILLGMFGPFLHSLRLHYVEFFTKFFKGGGKPFEPFGGR